MSKGLTLIEIAIGIAIISIAVVFVITAFPLGIRITDMNQKSNIALFLASSRLEEVISMSYDELEDGIHVEDFGDIFEFDNYRRITEIKCFNPLGGECFGDETGIRKIEVSTSSAVLGEREVRLQALISRR